ncbi:MAG TPA: endonuclease/exonuclease/phosphatase family protein [Mycobacteriales bacterium]|nr:endonuclease/exonuclease/phosphatase family protein [Mycobacteriales bacterium]
MTVLRLLSYNVRSLRGDPDAVVRVIQRVGPDLVCVQEAPRFWRWRTRCAELARASGLVVVTGGRGAAGNLLMCQLGVEVEHTVDLLLAPVPGMHRRGAAVAVCRLRGARFAVAGTHLDLNSAARTRHVGELLDRLPGCGVHESVPLVVAGDLNEEPAGRSWALLGERLVDAGAAAGSTAPTFPAASPRRRIDAVFADRRITVRSCQVIDVPDVRTASDHRPVLAELDLPDTI